jgi:hypothetical protein
MIGNRAHYEIVQNEIRLLNERLARLQTEYPIGVKGSTKAGIRKMLARLHEESAVYEARGWRNESKED